MAVPRAVGRMGAAILGVGAFMFIVVMLSKSEYKAERLYNVIGRQSLLDLFQERMRFPVERVRYDSKRLLQIYEHIRTAQEYFIAKEKFSVCLASQTSLERLYWLPQLLEHWDGLSSLTVFLENPQEWLLLNIYSIWLEKCYPKFRDLVSFHVALPYNTSVEQFSTFWMENDDKLVAKLLREGTTRPCGEFQDAKIYLQELVSIFGLPTSESEALSKKPFPYPQNHLRNIARKTCPTPWTYSVDIDIIPSNRMSYKLQEFYDRWASSPDPCQKCAFIVPTFELEADHYPQSKLELAAHFRNKSALPLNAFYPQAQMATDYEKWTSTIVLESATQVSHIINRNKTKFFEPFYVSSDTIPQYDERFLGYGLTRSSQFQEAQLAGWRFGVLTPVFAVHWGIHRPSFTVQTGYDPKKATEAERVREQQTAHNRQLFDKILKEMRLKQAEGIF